MTSVRNSQLFQPKRTQKRSDFPSRLAPTLNPTMSKQASQPIKWQSRICSPRCGMKGNGKEHLQLGPRKKEIDCIALRKETLIASLRWDCHPVLVSASLWLLTFPRAKGAGACVLLLYICGSLLLWGPQMRASRPLCSAGNYSRLISISKQFTLCPECVLTRRNQ